MSERTDELNRDTKLKLDAHDLLKYLFGAEGRDAGSLVIGANEWIACIHCSKKRWRGPMPSTWAGWPVKFRFNVGPAIAF